MKAQFLGKSFFFYRLPRLRGPLLLACLLMTLLGSTIPALPGNAAGAKPLPAGMEQGAYLVSKDGRIIMAHNPEALLIPASTWKIATALAALSRFGPDFRFETHFYLADHDLGHDLYIKGLGDPMLISEEVAEIAVALADQGLSRIRDLVIDDSYFQLEEAATAGAGDSLNPYDAANRALAVNFNTINVEIAGDKTVGSAEAQTPLLPVMRAAAAKAGLPPGRHRINLAHEAETSRRYSGELFQALLAQQGVEISGRLRSGPTPANARLYYRHRSSIPLSEVVRAMLLYSNNFIANQLFLACGAQAAGPPATWNKGINALTAFLRERGLPPQSFRVREGSGLSRENRISARAMLRLLDDFAPYAELLPSWRGRLVKSGTLSGVYAYAGYFNHGNRRDPVVLILNQPQNHRDRLLDYLEQGYRKTE